MSRNPKTRFSGPVMVFQEQALPSRATPAGYAATGKQRVLVPEIGDFKNIPVIEVLVAEGDVVEKDAPLLVLESDKSTMEVEAGFDGLHVLA